jgi:hypothetical protein
MKTENKPLIYINSKIKIILLIVMVVSINYVAEGHSFFYWFRMGLKSDYILENGGSGMDLNFILTPIDIQSESVFVDDLFKLGITINNLDKFNVKPNFRLLKYNVIGFSDRDTQSMSASNIEPTLINIEHTNQISTSIEWIKLTVGKGIGKYPEKNQDYYLGLYAGLGISSAYFDKNYKELEGKSIHGFLPNIGILFNYSNNFLRVTSVTEIKAIVFDKLLYEINPKIDFYLNISNLLKPELKVFIEKFLLLNVGISYSKLFYKSSINESLKVNLGLFYTLD